MNIDHSNLFLRKRILFQTIYNINIHGKGNTRDGFTPGNIHVLGKKHGVTFEYESRYIMLPDELKGLTTYLGWSYRPATTAMDTPSVWREYRLFVIDSPIDWDIEYHYNELRKSFSTGIQ